MAENRQSGFTLIELSIVLVIIGLIVGGVLAGRDLIRAAEIRKIAGTYTSYQVAYNTFKLKYNCIPGDCPNATSIFGTIDQNGNTVRDGDGDGSINPWTQEAPGVWQQMALGGLVPGAFTGVYGLTQVSNVVIGTNFPAVPTSPTNAFAIYSIAPSDWAVIGYIRTAVNSVLIGIDDNSWSPVNSMSQGIMSGPTVQAIDQKIDDGLPMSGQVIVNWSYWGCVNGSVGQNSYQLSSPTNGCSLFLRLE